MSQFRLYPGKRRMIARAETPYTGLIALWILRALCRLGVYAQLDDHPWVDRGEVLRRAGLSRPILEDRNHRRVLAALRRRLRGMEARSADPVDGPLFRNLDWFGQVLGLTEVDKSVIGLLILIGHDSTLASVCQMLGEMNLHKVCDVLAAVLHCPQEEIQIALDSRGVLRSAGIVKIDPEGYQEFEKKIGLGLNLQDAFLQPHPCQAKLLDRLLPLAAAPGLAPSDFQHVRDDYDLLRAYMAHSGESIARGRNILIHGRPGTGKTELVRTLCRDAGFTLYEIPMQNAEGELLDGKQRLAAYQLAQRLVAAQPKAAILFDEIEDVFSGAFLIRASTADEHKAWANRVLEEGKVTAFWLTNSVECMDVAVLRRFDYVFEQVMPGKAVRRRILEQHFASLGVRAEWLDRLSMSHDIAPAYIERAARMGQCVAGADASRVEQVAERALCGMLRAVGAKSAIPATTAVPIRYQLAHTNADHDLEKVIAGMGRSGAGRLCLYGPPGTGKTAFGQYLAECIGRPTVAARASDLLGSFVGETERNLAELFTHARAENAVLILDEVDSFLQDRSSAARSWEVTQVNELLVQIERYEGIFIASTNLVSQLDIAAFRRFDFKIRFEYPKPEQRFSMFRDVLHAAGWPEADDLAVWAEDFRKLDMLTPGDFAVVVRKLRILGEPLEPQRVLDALRRELATRPGVARIQIGFTGSSQVAHQ